MESKKRRVPLHELPLVPDEIKVKEPDDKFIAFPYPEEHAPFFKQYKKLQQTDWKAEDIHLEQDQKDWHLLSKADQFFLMMILAFFAAADGIVATNLLEYFMTVIELPTLKMYLTQQAANEMVHWETYVKLLMAFVPDPAKQKELLRAIQTISSIKLKAEWAKQWMTLEKPFVIRVIAFIIVEKVTFQSSFCGIFCVKRAFNPILGHGCFPGLTMSNKFISRDENEHGLTGILVAHFLDLMPEEGVVHGMVKDAIDIEKKFVHDMLPKFKRSEDVKTSDQKTETYGIGAQFETKGPKPTLPTIMAKPTVRKESLAQKAWRHVSSWFFTTAPPHSNSARPTIVKPTQKVERKEEKTSVFESNDVNADLMCQYLEYVADEMLVELKYNRLYNTANPFDWMEAISLETKENFFEVAPSSYVNASLSDASKATDTYDLTGTLY